jgi:hypothetical protein
MPSTYSPDLRIELIANGEQSGTWGTTTNNNLGTLIEDAISGAATVTVTTTNSVAVPGPPATYSYALTAANGASDEARCAMLIIGTTLTQSFNVFAPPVTKTYIIRNISGYNIALYCSTTLNGVIASGAGLNIPNGSTIFVRSEFDPITSTWAFYDAINHVSGNLDVGGSLTLGTALAVAEGGTGLSTVPARSIPVANVLNTLTTITPTANQSIRINSAGTAWEAYTPTGGSGTVTSVGLSGGTTGLTVASSPVTTSGTMTLGGTLAVANGGTGLTATPSNGQLDIGNGTGFTRTTLTAGSGISITNGSGSITIAATGGGGAVTSVSGSGAITASPSTGAVVVSVADASSGSSGVVNTTSQTFAGAKTFSSSLTANGFLSSSTSYNYTSTTSTFGSSSAVSFDISSSRAFNITASFINAGSDNVSSCGSVGTRWSVVYAATGTINTSDANTKQDIADLDDAEKRVAVRIKGLIKKFRFKDAVEAKGDDARIHVGVIAQEVRDAFTAEGLDANRYGLFCSDTWWEKEELVEYKHLDAPRLERVIHHTPVEGATEITQLGVRYDELLAFVIAAM